MSYFQVWIGMARFLFRPIFTFYKLKNIKRYSQLYSHALQTKRCQINHDIEEYSKKQK